jgi:CHAT domain-containing protein/Tfp pilus assembly protein PilF
MKIRWLLCVLVLTLPAEASEDATLVPGAPQSRSISSGESHGYRLVLAPGQYAEIDVLQKKIDLAIAAAGDGIESHEIDLLSPGDPNPEMLHVVARGAEPILITVRALPSRGKTVRTGDYEIVARELREATDIERTRLDAQIAYARGKKLVESGKALRIRDSIPEFIRALELSKRTDEKRMVAMSLIDLSSAYQAIRENAAALRTYEELLPALKAVGWNRNFGISHQTMGWIYESYGEYQKALEYHQKALEILKSEPDSASGHPTVLASIGTAYTAIGDYPKALESFERSLKIYRETKNQRGESIVLLDMAQVFAAQGDTTKALALLDDALKSFRETSNARREAQALAAIGRIHSSRGDYGQAQPMFDKALESTRATGDRRLEAIVLDELGELQLRQGALDAARGRFSEALAIQRAIQDRRNTALSLYGLARVDLAAGKLPEARTSIDEALSIVETIRGGVQPRELRVSFRAATSDLYEAQIGILMALHEREPDGGWAVKALEASEQARARALTEALQRVTNGLRAGDAALLEKERTLRAQIVDKESARTQFLLGEGGEAAAQADAELAAANADLAKTEAAIREASPRYAELVAPQTITLASIQRDLLDDDTALVEFTLGEKRSFVWAVTRDAVTVRPIAGRAVIDKAMRSAHALLTERNRTIPNEPVEARRERIARADRQAPPVMRELYDVLLRPVQSAIGGRRLLVVPDGPIHLVPFAALDDGTSTLSSKREIVVVPSASALAALRQGPERSRPAAMIAVLADPVFRSDDPRLRKHAPATGGAEGSRGGESLPRLRFSRREAELVSSMVSGQAKLVALDFDARREFLEHAGDYRILHFATHALVDSDAPERSSLVLSLVDPKGAPVDGYVRLGEIFDLDLRSDLVVLSACDTAAGKEMRGEGLMSLTHGFLYAGARRVVSTLWRVDDRATSELMKLFYRGMVREKLPAAAALARAQQQLARDKRWSAPYYWAGFVLQGEPR